MERINFKSIIFIYKDPGDCFMIQATRLVLISNEKQVSHYNGKKSFFSINSTHSEFLNKRTHKRKSRETFFISIYHFFKLIFSNHSKIIDWKSNPSKYFLSHIDQILDTLLVWAYCILLLFERAIIVYNKSIVEKV